MLFCLCTYLLGCLDDEMKFSLHVLEAGCCLSALQTVLHAVFLSFFVQFIVEDCFSFSCFG